MSRSPAIYSIGFVTPIGKIVGCEDGLIRNKFNRKTVNDWVYLIQPDEGKYFEISEKELIKKLVIQLH